MKKIWTSIQRWWLFNIANPKVRQGETVDGAFRWCFRRYDLTISTLSGNFTAKFAADSHPFGYLLAGESDENIIGFAQTIYFLSKSLTTDQELADDIGKAYKRYIDRLSKQSAAEVKEDEIEEKVALEEVKQVQEYVEASPKGKRQRERDANGRFKKVVKELEKSE